MLTFVVFQTKKHYNELTTRTKRRTIDDVLDELMKETAGIGKGQEVLKKHLADMELRLQGSFRKIGMIRFNAFGKAQGEQSFVIALLSEKNSGLVINFIYTPEGVRVYSKTVSEGKTKEYSLSAEEQEAIQKAQ